MPAEQTRRRRRPLPRSIRLLGVLAAGALATLLVLAPAAVAAAATPTPSASSSINPATAKESIEVWIRKVADRSNVQGVKVTVSLKTFTTTVVSGRDGKVEVGLPGIGVYTVSMDQSTVPKGAGSVPSGLNPRQVEVDDGNKQVPAYFNLVSAAVTAPTGSASASASPAGGGSSSSGSTGTDFATLVFPRMATGLIFGLLLALASIGVSLIYGTTGLNNFAHGELVTFGGLMGYLLTTTFNLPGPVAIIGATVLGGAFGYLQDLGLWKPLRRRGIALVPLMIVSIGLSLALRYLFEFIFGADPLTLPADTSAAVILGPVRLRSTDVISVGLCILLLLGVAFVLLRTRIGKATRAVSDNRSLAAASGIDVERVIRLVWVGGGALAGIAGVLIAYYQSISWTTGASILLLIFAAVTLGGFGTAFGALIGSLVIGLITDLSTIVIPANMKYVAALLVMIVILLIRPQGILGRRSRVG